MNQSTMKTAKKFGFFGLVFNVCIILLSLPGFSWSFLLSENSIELISLFMIVLGVLAAGKIVHQNSQSNNSVNFGYGARIGWISGSLAVLPVALISVGIGLGLMYYSNLNIHEGDEWLWLLGAAIIGQSVLYASTISFCILSAGITAIILNNSKQAVSAIKDIGRS